MHSQSARVYFVDKGHQMIEPAPIESFDENKFCWAGGTLLLKKHNSYAANSYKFLREDIAICVAMPADSDDAAALKISGDLAEFRSLIVTPPRLLVIPPGHKFEAHCTGTFHCLWIFVDRQSVVASEEIKSFTQTKRINSSWSKSPSLFKMTADLVKEGLQGFPRGQSSIDDSVSSLMKELARYFARGRTQFNPAALSDDKLNVVMDYIERNVNRNIALSELSALVELTQRYFCASFKKAMGRPPHWFHLERRIERAKVLLHDTDLTLAQIADTIGFNSETHLVHCFRRIEGTTPGRYRTEHSGCKV
jgi:AraC family transcriptional regulator